MNSFVDSPFLFFVDNVPPIFADDPGEDRRKIIEISDVGCDAITTTMASQNNSQHPRTRTTTVKNSRPRYEERSTKKFYREKWRQNEEIARNLGKTFSIPKQVENVHRPSIDEHRWKKPTARNEANDTPTPKKTPNTRDTKISPSMPWERPRLNRWNKGNVQEIPPDLEVNPEKRPMSCPAQRRPTTLQSAAPKIEPKIVPKISEKFMFDKRNTIVTLEPDYPEVFDHGVSKDRWQNPTTPISRNQRKPIDETAQKTQRQSRSKKTTRIPPAEGKNPEQPIEDPQARKIRSRTRSPPGDRQKRTRSTRKSNDPEQVESQQHPESIKDPNSRNFDADQSGSLNCARSVEKIRRFVDRGVDRDSICDLLKVSTSTDATVAATSSMDTGKSEKIIGFWEFVPLEDESDLRRKIAGNRKTRCLLDHRMFRDNDYHPLKRQLVNDDDASSSRTKVKESTKRSLDPDRNFISENMKYADRCPAAIEEDTDLSSEAYRREESARSVEVLHRTRLDSRTEVNVEGKYYETNHDQSWGEPKHQPKPARVLGFGWPGKNRHLKRENDAKHGEEGEKKKKLQNEEKTSGLKFIEKTAACLKRKLEGTQKEDNVLGKCSELNIEKKIRSEVSANSKLPIRIGKRLKSKNPIVGKFTDSLKSKLPDEEQERGAECVGTVRSRTKPRIKPSVELRACPVSVDNVRTVGRVVDQSANGRDEKLGERFEYGEQDSRRKEFANRFYARNGTTERMDTDVSRNSRLKEKCFFHIHNEENRICDQYCKGMRCEKVCQ